MYSPSVNLTYGNSYKLCCSASNSHPGGVFLNIFANNINLNEYSNSSVEILNSSVHCDPSLICTSILELNLTFNDPLLFTINTFSCNAISWTAPYNINITDVVNVRFERLPPQIINFSLKIPIAFVRGSIEKLLCLANDTSPFWLYSPDGNQSFYIDYSNPNFLNDFGSLYIINIDQTKNGLFACGYISSNNSFTAYTTYDLFVEGINNNF